MPGIIKPVVFYKEEVASGPIPLTADTNSIEFRPDIGTPASSERLRALTSTIGIANTWTIMVTYRWQGTPLASGIGLLEIGIVNANRITILISASSGMRIVMRDTGGNVAYDYRAVSMQDNGIFIQAFWTFNGSSIRVYKNGVDVTPTATTNLGTAQADTSRVFILGSNVGGTTDFFGSVYQCAVWNTVLSPSSILDLNSGQRTNDLTKSLENNYGQTEANALRHWWRLGHQNNLGGTDLGNSPLDLSADNIGITLADIISAAP